MNEVNIFHKSARKKAAVYAALIYHYLISLFDHCEAVYLVFIFFSCCHYIYPGRLYTGVSEHICKSGKIFIVSVEFTGKKLF